MDLVSEYCLSSVLFDVNIDPCLMDSDHPNGIVIVRLGLGPADPATGSSSLLLFKSSFKQYASGGFKSL